MTEHTEARELAQLIKRAIIERRYASALKMAPSLEAMLMHLSDKVEGR
jgi:hypothetical protein